MKKFFSKRQPPAEEVPRQRRNSDGATRRYSLLQSTFAGDLKAIILRDENDYIRFVSECSLWSIICAFDEQTTDFTGDEAERNWRELGIGGPVDYAQEHRTEQHLDGSRE